MSQEQKECDCTPRLRFPEFRKTQKWKKVILGDICSFFRGKGISKGDISLHGGTPCIRYGELYTYYHEVIKSVKSFTNVNSNSLFFSKKNDILIPSSGETKEDIATASCLLLEGVALGGDLHVLRTKCNGIFISYYINYGVKNSISKVAQGDTIVHLYSAQLKTIKLYLPSLSEQQKIADCLSSLDELIEAHEQKCNVLRQHKKGLMQRLFPAEGENTPRWRFPEFQDMSSSGIGRKWKRDILQNIASPVMEKGDLSHKYTVLTLSCDYGLLVQTDYFGKNIGGSNYNRYIKINKDDFIYNDRTTKSYPYGTIKRSLLPFAGLVSPIYKCFRFIEGTCPAFWQYYFDAHCHEYELKNIVNEGTRVGRFNISIKQFLTISVSFPEKKEQQKIADCLSAIDERIAAEEDKIAALREHRKGLMQQLFPVM